MHYAQVVVKVIFEGYREGRTKAPLRVSVIKRGRVILLKLKRGRVILLKLKRGRVILLK